MRRTLILRAALAGTAVGTSAAIVVWGIVVVLAATGRRDDASGLTAAALALGPVLVVGGTALGAAVGLALGLGAPALRRGGAARATVLVVVALLAFGVWGTAAGWVASKESFVVGGLVSTDGVLLVATALGAVAGAAVTVVAERGRPLLRRRGSGRVMALWVVVGVPTGLLAWWVRRSGVPLLTGMPAEGSFVGSGFGDSDLPITLEWVWAVVTGAFAGLVVAAVVVVTGRSRAAVPAAAVVAGVAAFVSATTGLVFPALGEWPLSSGGPFVGGFATSVTHLPVGAVLLTTLIWALVGAAVAGAVTMSAARVQDRVGRASRPV